MKLNKGDQKEGKINFTRFLNELVSSDILHFA